METWIKLYRKFDEWEWFNVSEMVHLFIYLLINANNSDNEWHGMEIKRGQIITGRKSLHEKTGISEQTLRTCLSRLEKTKEITIKSTNKYSIITICKYNDYQPQDLTTNQPINQQSTNNQPTINQQLTTIKEVKEDKKKKIEEELRARALIFKTEVLTFQKQYKAIPTLKEFYEYWSESNPSKTKMKFEMEKTWEISKRLVTWANREKSFKKVNGSETNYTAGKTETNSNPR